MVKRKLTAVRGSSSLHCSLRIPGMGLRRVEFKLGTPLSRVIEMFIQGLNASRIDFYTEGPVRVHKDQKLKHAQGLQPQGTPILLNKEPRHKGEYLITGLKLGKGPQAVPAVTDATQQPLQVATLGQ